MIIWNGTANVNNSCAWLEKAKSVSSGYDYKFTGTMTHYENNRVVESVSINSAIVNY
ncbi:MAG: hypothetical protein LBL49_10695 [Clostridiales Family XIII bacterium]|jgi:hypothetical protein|nr:hypothetical protein [Clostridiales Family XIII bacterium]